MMLKGMATQGLARNDKMEPGDLQFAFSCRLYRVHRRPDTNKTTLFKTQQKWQLMMIHMLSQCPFTFCVAPATSYLPRGDPSSCNLRWL